MEWRSRKEIIFYVRISPTSLKQLCKVVWRFPQDSYGMLSLTPEK
jgi:hypothetical protein